MFYPLHFPIIRRVAALLFFCPLTASAAPALTQSPPAQETPANPQAAPEPGTPAATAQESEVAQRDAPASFKVRVNLVQVRVVVRDSNGKAVENLHKEDFQLFDGRKLQTIAAFAAETPASRRVIATPETGAEASSQGADANAPASIALPERFVALVFDDGHMEMSDAVFARDAAKRFLASVSPTDRLGIYTSSGQLTQEFTSDHAMLEKALYGIVPHPTTGSFGHECPDINYYQADLIQNKNDTQALAVATEEAIQCAFGGDSSRRSQAQSLATAGSVRALTAGDSQSEYSYRHLEQVLRRLSGMPGERVMVLISPGFLMSTLMLESADLVDRANRANVVINTVDVRGLYTPDLLGDIADPAPSYFLTAGYKSSYRIAAQTAQSEILAEFAAGTGGTFFHSRNDIEQGLRLAAVAPTSSYLLGFSPQNMKLDGAYHTLRVALVGKQKYSIQARRGYYAPRGAAKPEDTAKQEIQEALFSQEEIHDIPLQLQTQFFKKDETAARLSVLSRLDLKELHFRKAEGRNLDNLAVATAIFDENGNFVTGGEKMVEMKLLQSTYVHFLRSGLTVKSSFDVKPGKYLVRQVVRDTEGSQMAARNGAVVIPY
jgi:VWFA-related protein